jgi:hypothetical protein
LLIPSCLCQSATILLLPFRHYSNILNRYNTCIYYSILCEYVILLVDNGDGALMILRLCECAYMIDRELIFDQFIASTGNTVMMYG